jgi:hypothetical protein
MSSKELKRTKKRLKERERLVPAVVFKRKRKHRMTGRLITMSSAELAGQKQDLRLPIVNERMGGNGGRKRVHAKPLPRKYVEGGPKLTNGVNVNPALIAAIKGVDDVRVAKRVAKVASGWFRKLYALEEMQMAKKFREGEVVWFLKRKEARAGVVIKLKTRKLVVRTFDGDMVMPVRKVMHGGIPKEYLELGGERWAIGRKAAQEGGETKSAEAVV